MRFEKNDPKLISVFVDKNTYSEDVLYKCFYWYGAKFNVTISSHAHDELRVDLELKADYVYTNEMLAKIKRDLIDFKLRDIVSKETRVIRELIIAKAFAYYDIEENPSSEISDPVGFDPGVVKS